MRYVKFLALLLLFFFTMALFAQNMQALSQPLELSFNLLGRQWFDFSYPVYLHLLGVLVVGGILSMIFFLTERFRLTSLLGRCRSKLSSLEQEVNSLRTLPLEDQDRSFAAPSTSTSALADDEDDEPGQGA